MRVAISVLEDVSRSNGTVVRARQVFKLLAERHDVHLISRGNRTSEDDRIIWVGPTGTRMWNIKLMPIVLDHDFECIYCASDFLGFITYYLLSKFKRYHLVFEAHGIISREFSGGHPHGSINKFKYHFFRILERFVISRADCVVALSNDIKEFYKDYNDRIEVVPVFVETMPEMRRANLSPRNSIRVGLIGPFETGNINSDFVRFVSDHLDEFDTRICFVFVGKCGEDCKIHDSRLLYTNYIESRQDYLHAVAQLDVVLIPSMTPSYGPLTKIIEAMSLGVPIVTTPAGAIGLDHVRNNEDIIIVNENDIPDAVNSLVFNDRLMSTLGMNARATVQKHYSREATQEKIMASLECQGGL